MLSESVQSQFDPLVMHMKDAPASETMGPARALQELGEMQLDGIVSRMESDVANEVEYVPLSLNVKVPDMESELICTLSPGQLAVAPVTEPGEHALVTIHVPTRFPPQGATFPQLPPPPLLPDPPVQAATRAIASTQVPTLLELDSIMLVGSLVTIPVTREISEGGPAPPSATPS